MSGFTGSTTVAGRRDQSEGRLKVGHCTVAGTDTDPGHARGKWTFTLTITTG
jgi:hypothetical protein